jgi:WD40 repeat protein
LKTLLVAVLLVAAYFVYELFIHTSPKVESGLAVPHKMLTGHTHQLWAVRFSPDGSVLASGGADTDVHLWQPQTGAPAGTLPQLSGTTALEWSPDGKSLITASYDGVIRVWDVAARRVVQELKGHAGTVWTLAISADGRTLASGGEDKTVKLWDLAKATLLKTLSGHSMNIWKVRFTPGGQHVVSSSFDNSIKIWTVAEGTLVRTLEGHKQAVVGLDISPDGRTIASASDDKTLKLWDFESGKLIRTLEGWKEHVYAVAFSPDGKRIVSSNRDNGAGGELLQNFFGKSSTPKGVTVRLWDVATGKLLQTFSDHRDDVMDVTFSPDGQYIASASTDHTVGLWKVVKQ